MIGALRCYVCGVPLAGRFYLVAMTTPADRVMVVSQHCLPRVRQDDVAVQVLVKVADES